MTTTPSIIPPSTPSTPLHLFVFDPVTALWTVHPWPDDSLTALQQAVGGYIEMLTSVPIRAHRCDFYVDDEGLLKPHPVIGWAVQCRDYTMPFAGALAVCGSTDDGESVGLPLALLQPVRELVRRLTVGELRELLKR